MRVPTLFLLAAALVPLTALSAEPDWRFADSRAVLIGGFHGHSLAESRFVRALLFDLARRHGATLADIDRMMKPFDGVDQVCFSLSSASRGAPEVLIYVNGNLEGSPAPMLLQNSGAFKSVSIDDKSIVLGTPALVDQAVARMHAPVAADSPLIRRARELAPRDDFWMAAHPSAMASSSDMARNLEAFSFGVNVQRQFWMEARFDTHSEEIAEQLAGALEDGQDETADSPLARAMVVDTNGSVVEIHATADARSVVLDFAKQVREFAGEQVGTLVASLRTAAAAAAKPAPEPPPRKPVIYGLDDGPREVK